MSNKHDDKKEPKEPETLEEALKIIAYHSGVFFFKVVLIICLWVWIVELIRQWMMP